MKKREEVLEFESIILRREMAKPKWYEGLCNQSNASKMKARLADKTLHRNTIKEIMDHLGYEKVIDPVDAMYRKSEIRTFEVFEDGNNIGNVKAKTKTEACEIASKSKYGETETFKDQKGRTVLLWELNAKDMEAQEVI